MTNIINHILANNGNNGEDRGWMQILIFIFIAVFYGLSSIIKAKAAKNQQKESLQSQPKKPQPLSFKFTDLQSKLASAINPRPREYRKITIPPQKKPSELTSPSPGPKPVKPRIATSLEPAAEPSRIEELFDYSDPTELRKAILYHEILGKPIALRKP